MTRESSFHNSKSSFELAANLNGDSGLPGKDVRYPLSAYFDRSRSRAYSRVDIGPRSSSTSNQLTAGPGLIRSEHRGTCCRIKDRMNPEVQVTKQNQI